LAFAEVEERGREGEREREGAVGYIEELPAC